MRSLLRRSVVISSFLVCGVVWSGCEAKQATEYVTGISTQVTVPRDLKAVRVEVTVGGVPQFCRGYKVYDGKVQLPRSLGTFASTEGAITSSGPITYTIAGLTTDDIENTFFAACTQARVKSDDVRILRRSRQPYIRDEILFLPMPLKYSCYDKVCDDQDGTEMTCKGGKCVPATLTDEEIKNLPQYSPDLVDGTGATCFSRAACMTPALPAVVVDPSNCTYAVPSTPSSPEQISLFPKIEIPATGDGVNVEITYDGGLVREILDKDLQEGFFIPDPVNNPQQFRLAEGLCEMVKGVDAQGNPTAHRITAVRTNGRCQPKDIAQPLCAADQLAAMGLDPNGLIPNPPPVAACATAELKPPRTAMVVVVDDTQQHEKFFAALNKQGVDPADEESVIGPILNGLLADPIFQRTDVGVVYAPGANGCSADAALDIPFGLAGDKRDDILNSMKSRSLIPEPVEPSYEGALVRAYNALKASDDYFRRAVVVLGNNGFDGSDCGAGGTRQRAEEALADATKPIRTYVMQLTTQPDPQPEAADLLAASGGTEAAAHKAGEAKAKFQELVNSLATCIYEVDDDPSQPVDGDIVSFSDPINPDAPPKHISFNAACSAEGVAGEGWGYAPGTSPQGKKLIHLCQASCDAYRGVYQQAALFSATYGQPTIPVPLFFYKAVCTAGQSEE